MSTSSNITLRPSYRVFTRLTDNASVLVNLDLVRTIEPIAGGLRLTFGNAASDRLDVKQLTIEMLREQLTP